MARRLAVMGAMLGLLAAAPVHAKSQSTNTTPISLNVRDSCTLSTTPLDFGFAMILTLPIDSTAHILLNCRPGTAYNVAIDNGKNFSGSTRRMVSNSGFAKYVSYQVYRNAARTQVWGQGGGQTATGIIPASGAVDLTAYGRVPFSLVSAATYTDTLVVTLTF